MVQLLPGLLYVLVITVVFTALLIGGTAIVLLTQARAIVRRRSLGSVVSKGNVRKALKFKTLLITRAGLLVSVQDESINRKLTTFTRPAELRLSAESLYVRPIFSRSAYLVPLIDVLETSLEGSTLVIAFTCDDHRIVLRCKTTAREKWFNTLNKLIANINSVINNKPNYPVR